MAFDGGWAFEGGCHSTTAAVDGDSGRGHLIEGRVTTVAAMYDNEASAEDYGDRVEDVMGGGGRGGRGGRGLDEDDNHNDGNGSSDNERQRQQRRQRRQRQ